MKNYVFIFLIQLVVGCTKQISNEFPQAATSKSDALNLKADFFQAYTIQEGAHYSDQRTVKPITGNSMHFIVKFDSSALYPSLTTDYNHALDANKLYGFSEGNDNQVNSARIGWRYYNNQLQLMAYVHKNGVIQREPESYDPPVIRSVPINTEITCSIAVSGYTYIFTVDGVSMTMPRALGTATFDGLQQYPYFGGTMVAPQKITIYIKLSD